MGNRLDDAIVAYMRDLSDTSLLELHSVFLAEKLHVPVSEPAKELQPGCYDIAVICVRTEAGGGAIPVFTDLEHLFAWKPEGCLYTSIVGRSLLAMAINMDAIDEILVNLNDVPRGRIPRADFERMLVQYP